MKVDGAVRSLIQGVSQQPREQRLPGQCSLQENFRSDPVFGLTRRPPIEFLTDIVDTEEQVHELELAFSGDKYYALVAPSAIYLVDTAGEVKELEVPEEVRSYISAGDLMSISIDNTAFIASRNVQCKMLPGLSEYLTKSSLVAIKGGQYGRTFKITVTWATGSTSASFTTPDGGSSSHITQVKTTYIATQLATALDAVSDFSTRFTVTRAEDVLWIRKLSDASPDFTVQVSDDEGGTLMVVCNNSVTNVGDLPRYAPAGYYAVIEGSAESNADNLYLAFEPTSGTKESLGTGTAEISLKTNSSGQLIDSTGIVLEGGSPVLVYGDYTEVVVNIANLGINTTYKVVRQNLGSSQTAGISVETGQPIGTPWSRLMYTTVQLSGTILANTWYWESSTLGRTPLGAGTVKTNQLCLSFSNLVRTGTGLLQFGTGAYAKTSTGALLQLAAYVAGSFGQAGVWKECVKVGEEYRIDPYSMPFGISMDPITKEFDVHLLDWEDRKAGDEDSNPIPSFINKKINDLSYFQSRLVFLAGSAVIMSRTNKHTSFWRDSSTQQVDTDVIDIQSTYDGVSEMTRAVPHNRDLIIFSPEAQFIVLGRNKLTPDNSSLILTTTFEADLQASPVSAGRNVFFGITYGAYAGVREFFNMDSVDANDSRPITQHVLKYLQAPLKRLAGSSNYDMLIALPAGQPKAYVYEYLLGDQGKKQSSWSTWTLPWEPVNVWFDVSTVFMLRKSGTQYSMWYMQLDVLEDPGLTYKVHLDNRKTVQMETGVIEIPEDPAGLVFIRGEGCSVPGMRILPKSISGEGPYTVDFDEVDEDGTIIYGTKYLSRYRPTMPAIKDDIGAVVDDGRFLVSSFVFSGTQSGKLWYKKVSRYRDDSPGSISGRFTNDPRTVVGQEAIQDGLYSIPFRDKVRNAELEIYTDEHTPMTLTTFEFQGQYNHHGTRVSQGN